MSPRVVTPAVGLLVSAPSAGATIHLSSLEELILSAIASKRRYGLQVKDAVEMASKGEIQLPLGSLYTTLRRLEKKGLADSDWEKSAKQDRGAKRRFYWATDAGRETLRRRQELQAHVRSI